MTQIVLDLVDDDYVDISTTTKDEAQTPAKQTQAENQLDYSKVPEFCTIAESEGIDPVGEDSLQVGCNSRDADFETDSETESDNNVGDEDPAALGYNMQPMLLEQQNKKLPMMARPKQEISANIFDSIDNRLDSHSTPGVNFKSRPENLQDYQIQSMHPEQRNKKRLMMIRGEQEGSFLDILADKNKNIIDNHLDSDSASGLSIENRPERLQDHQLQLLALEQWSKRQAALVCAEQEIMDPGDKLNRNLDFVSKYIDSISETLRPIGLKIHDNPELNYKEFIAHKTLVEFMKTRKGWIVTPSAYGIPTAFIAVYDSGKEGPVISYNAEYDALTGIGHACGHNLIAIASLAAALASGAAIEEFSLIGKVILFGTPAEEGGGGKIKLLNAGAYSDHKVDMNLIAHPGKTPDSVLVRTNAYMNFKVEYFGKEAHAAAAPWEGINALDALITAYNALSVLRQQTMAGDIIQGHITNGGSAPNIIHAYAAGVFVVRALNKKRLAVLRDKVKMCFKAGAQATGARLKMTNIMGYDDHVPNLELGIVCREVMNKMGGKVPEQVIDLIKGATQASTDQGNISYAMPSLSLGFEIESVEGPHNPGFTKSARTEQAHGAALRAGKGLAVTGLQALIDKSLLEAAKKEFEEMKKQV